MNMAYNLMGITTEEIFEMIGIDECEWEKASEEQKSALKDIATTEVERNRLDNMLKEFSKIPMGLSQSVSFIGHSPDLYGIGLDARSVSKRGKMERIEAEQEINVRAAFDLGLGDVGRLREYWNIYVGEEIPED
jgi:hypothetical protein